jgi:hypothetical protein
MTSLMYKEQLPDWGDSQQNTKSKLPGYRLYVEANDGKIGICLQPSDRDEVSCEEAYAAALTIEQAEELIRGVQDAIKHAIS